MYHVLILKHLAISIVKQLWSGQPHLVVFGGLRLHLIVKSNSMSGNRAIDLNAIDMVEGVTAMYTDS